MLIGNVVSLIAEQMVFEARCDAGAGAGAVVQ